MSDHLIKCDTCGMLMYPGSPEHIGHACRPPAPASRAATAGEKRLVLQKMAEEFLHEKKVTGSFNKQVRTEAYIAGHASATKGLRERLEGAKARVSALCRYVPCEKAHIGDEALATLTALIEELKKCGS
jgi:hypothetical protein